jgi:hypothetical protein
MLWGRIVAELRRRALYSSTAIMVTAKHGPVGDRSLEAGEERRHALETAGSRPLFRPNGDFGQNATKSGNLNDGTVLVDTGMVQSDDVGLVWLRNNSELPVVVKTLKDNLGRNAREFVQMARRSTFCMARKLPRVSAIQRAAACPISSCNRIWA